MRRKSQSIRSDSFPVIILVWKPASQTLSIHPLSLDGPQGKRFRIRPRLVGYFLSGRREPGVSRARTPPDFPRMSPARLTARFSIKQRFREAEAFPLHGTAELVQNLPKNEPAIKSEHHTTRKPRQLQVLVGAHLATLWTDIMAWKIRNAPCSGV